MTVEEDVPLSPFRERQSRYPPIQCQLSKQNSMRPSVKTKHSVTSSISSATTYLKYHKVTISLFLLMDRLVREKLTPCLAVIGKTLFLSMSNSKSIKIPFSRTYCLMKIMQDLFPGPFLDFSKRYTRIVHSKATISIYIVPFCKSTTKRSTICCK